MTYQNTPTVVVVLIPHLDKLVLIRRALPTGKGQLALPGGYQMLGETWQQAGEREVYEELGITVTIRKLINVISVEDGKINLLFCEAWGIDSSTVFNIDTNEVEEVVLVDQPVVTAFDAHDKMVKWYFDSQR